MKLYTLHTLLINNKNIKKKNINKYLDNSMGEERQDHGRLKQIKRIEWFLLI